MKYYELTKPELNDDIHRFLEEEETDDRQIEETVISMLNHIKKDRFKAIQEYTKRFDNFDLTEENFRVSKEEVDALASKIDPDLSKSLETAIERIRNFHEKEKENSFEMQDIQGNNMGQKVVPLDSIAVYTPGGEALYPSTLYMAVVPALIAGVKRIVLLSPPRTFEESPEVARLMQLLGITEAYRVGGAQAVIAASYGSGSLKPVDKIVGPGNAYVAKAKQLVYGKVDIDMIAGPSEILVIADTDKEDDIPLLAADLLSQAEHGPAGFNRTMLVGFNKDFLKKVEKETYRQANELPTDLKKTAITSLDKRGLIVCCPDRMMGIEISNLLAPEHLELFSDDPYSLLEKVKHAGSVFVGKFTPESVGDYIGGPNHVLPTSRTAKFYSPLGVYDYQKRISWIEFSELSLRKYLPDITQIARSEGLEAHARCAEIRFSHKPE